MGITITDLIACLSIGKGTWGKVARLMQEEDWGNIFLITNDFGKEKFTHEKKFSFVALDFGKSAEELKNDIIAALKDKLPMEVALNMESGTGKEHMALIAALLKLGAGIRLVTIKEEAGVMEI